MGCAGGVCGLRKGKSSKPFVMPSGPSAAPGSKFAHMQGPAAASSSAPVGPDAWRNDPLVQAWLNDPNRLRQEQLDQQRSAAFAAAANLDPNSPEGRAAILRGDLALPPGQAMRISGGQEVPMTENYFDRIQAQHNAARAAQGLPPQTLTPPPGGFASPGLFSGGENPYSGVPPAPGTGIAGRFANAVGGTGNAFALGIPAAVLGAGLASGAIPALFGGGSAAAPGAAAAPAAGGLGGASSALPAAASLGGTAATGGMDALRYGMLGAGLGAGAAGLASHYQQNVRSGRGGGMQFPRFTPEQEQIMDQMMRMGATQAQASQAAQPFDFEPQAEAARRGFAQRTVPTIMGRYTGLMGGRGGTRSSGLQQQLAQAGQDLESNLAALRSKFGLQAEGVRQSGMGQLLNAGLQPRFDTAFAPKAPGFMSSLGSGLGQAAGMVPGMMMQSLFR